MTTTPVLDGFDELLSSNVVLVTGKGGVGKTTVAAVLALAGVASGRRTLLVEVEERQGFSRTFGTQPWDYDEREFRPGLWGTALDPSDAVYEYLEMFYGLKRVQWVMERSNAIDFVTTAAPGLRDLLMVGKLYEIEARRREDGRRQYDLIVLDAPPTGRIVPFLQAPEGVTEIVRVGPVKRQAGQIREMLDNPKRVQAVLVTLLEEMPVQETVEGVQKLRAAGIAIGPIVTNKVMVERVSASDAKVIDGLPPDALASAGNLSGQTAALTKELVTAHRGRLALQHELRDDLASRAELPILDLPLITGKTFGEDDLHVLTDVLAEQLGEKAPRAREAVPADWRPR